jgi:putative hydrolase of the HAD superfamily
MLKSVSFDLWETLITDTPSLSRAQERLRLTRMEEILTSSGHGALAGRIEHAYRALWHRCQELYWSADKDVPCRTQIEHFLDELEITVEDPATLDALEDAYAHAAVEVLPAVVDGAAETLRALKSQGLQVGLISNTGRTPGYALRRVLDELGLAPFIDVMVFSNEHGFCKPVTSIFEELRGGLDVAYEEMAFVGDNLYADVHGAQRLGMVGIHFTPEKRGTAVAPPVDHGLEIVPDAVIRDLRELIAFVERL